MLLSDVKILSEMKKGNIVIEPFVLESLGANSYDVKLGENFYFPNPNFRKAFDVFDQHAVSEFFMYEHHNNRENVTLPPNATALCHTVETIGGRNAITCILRCRSSVMRCGLSIAKCAGVGDVGYVNRWTMALSNHNTVPVTIKVGMRIGHILFFRVGRTLKEYRGKYYKGQPWSPEQMLPRLWEDL